jgi:adenylate cyclase
MPDTSNQRRLAAILAADVADYTKLVHQDTDATVKAWNTARDDVIKPFVARKSGHIIKFTGDGFLVEFPSVQNAVACAIRPVIRGQALAVRDELRTGCTNGCLIPV